MILHDTYTEALAAHARGKLILLEELLILRKREHKDLDRDAQIAAIEVEMAEAERQYLEAGVTREDNRLEKAETLYARLKEQRKAIADAAAKLRSAEEDHEKARAAAVTTRAELRSTAREAWPDGPPPRDEDGTQLARLYLDEAGYLIFNGTEIGLREDRARE